MARVSVVIPTYNRAHFVAQALESVLSQELADLEVVVVDDGSTDDTREVVGGFVDSRIVYVHQQNQGATAAFNRGIAETTGEYISVLGSDDWYLPDGLVPLYQYLEDYRELGAASGGFLYVDAVGNVLRESLPWQEFPRLDAQTWLFSCPTILQSSLVRRKWVELVGGFDTNVTVVQDWDFGLRLAHVGCRMGWVEKPVFYYRLHGSQITRDATAIRRDYQVVLNKFFSQPDVPPDLLSLRARAYSHAYVKGALRAFEAHQWQDGRDDLEHAIRLDPSLMERRGQPLLELLIGWARGPQNADPTECIASAFRNLPKSAAPLRPRERDAQGALAMAEFFGAHEVGDASRVRRAFLRGILHDPSWLQNRGVWSIAFRAFLGGARRASGVA